MPLYIDVRKCRTEAEFANHDVANLEAIIDFLDVQLDGQRRELIEARERRAKWHFAVIAALLTPFAIDPALSGARQVTATRANWPEGDGV